MKCKVLVENLMSTDIEPMFPLSFVLFYLFTFSTITLEHCSSEHKFDAIILMLNSGSEWVSQE